MAVKKSKKLEGLKVVEMVFSRNGENVGTIAPFCSIEKFKYSLDDESQFCANADDNRLVTAKRFFLKNVLLPVWMDADTYANDYVGYEYLWGRNDKTAYLPQKEQEFLVGQEAVQQVSYGKLLQVKKFRSSFRESMAKQVRDFIYNENNKFNSPLSFKQFRYIAVDNWEATRGDDRIYHNRYYDGVSSYLLSQIQDGELVF